MKLRRILTLGGSILLGVIVLGLDLIRTSVDLDITGLMVVRNLLVIAAFVLLYFFLEIVDKPKGEHAVQQLGLILVAGVAVALISGAVMLAGDSGSFETKEGNLLPLNFRTIFLSSFFSLSVGLFALLLFRRLLALVLYKRKRGTWRNLMIQSALMVLTSASTIPLDPLETSVTTSVLFGLSVAAMVPNSFRHSWIVYLTRREKVFALIYSFLLFGILTFMNIIHHGNVLNQSLLYHSYPALEFSSLTLIFGNIYFGMAFVSTLFHLPTAEAFEKKTTEIASLHNLGKLINQVFDFNEMVETVTSMVLQASEAKACWLEVFHPRDEYWAARAAKERGMFRLDAGGRYVVQVVGRKNISLEQIEEMLPFGERTLRDAVVLDNKAMIVDEISKQESMKKPGGKKQSGSLVIVPLISHSGLIGILFATKETDFGFFKDDVEVISAFADQATIAIENSRLIDKSLERERLMQEMRLAQEMQKRLLPQTLPQHPFVQLDASSTPAFEVGGDYYDFVLLGGNRLGIVVGDVSGKGVSAAFYMSEVKGIFQSLSKIHSSPREFLLKANEALSGSMDRRSFVSLIYAVMDLATGSLTVSRAGHCPMILAKSKEVTYIRPSGMGLGLSVGETFANAIAEETMRLDPGDVCVFYTDGLTEARRGEDEYGYERLLECIETVKDLDASTIKSRILEAVRSFTDSETMHDDLTIVVLKWCPTIS